MYIYIIYMIIYVRICLHFVSLLWTIEKLEDPVFIRPKGPISAKASARPPGLFKTTDLLVPYILFHFRMIDVTLCLCNFVDLFICFVMIQYNMDCILKTWIKTTWWILVDDCANIWTVAKARSKKELPKDLPYSLTIVGLRNWSTFAKLPYSQEWGYSQP